MEPEELISRMTEDEAKGQLAEQAFGWMRERFNDPPLPDPHPGTCPVCNQDGWLLTLPNLDPDSLSCIACHFASSYTSGVTDGIEKTMQAYTIAKLLQGLVGDDPARMEQLTDLLQASLEDQQ